jgi:hypothetical protein
MAASMLWLRQASDSYGILGLALNACDERANGHQEGTERIRKLLLVTRDLWEAAASIEDEAQQRRATRGAFRLLHLANVLAVTNAE